MKHKIIRAMAYLYMPFLFMVLGYFIIYIAAIPVFTMLQATASMVIAKAAPDFNQELKSIYNPIDNQEVIAPQQQDMILESMTAYPGKVSNAEKLVSIEDIMFPDNGTLFANLSCERIKLDAPVYWGDTNEILRAGVGQFMGSFLPGLNRSILLSGHNTTYFKPIKDMEVDDVIIFQTNYGVFEYQVTEIKVIPSSDAKDMLDEMLSYKVEKLIMYTCYPFETLVGTKQDRLFIFADKISGPTVE